MTFLTKYLAFSAVCQVPTTTDDILMARCLPHQPTDNKMSNVLARLGYFRQTQHTDYIKLLGITGGLPAPEDRLLTDEEATLALNRLQFESDREAFDWLLNTTQEKWIRKTASQEGAGGPVETKLARWFAQDSGALAEYSEKLQGIVDNLGFFSGTTWQESTPPAEIWLMGGLESHIVDRLEALSQLTPFATDVPLNYLTGDRGVFNFEPSLAPMLAQEWFKDATLEGAIRQILVNNTKDWKDGRAPQLQLLILSAIEQRNAKGEVVLTQPKALELVALLDAEEKSLEAEQLLDTFWPQEGLYYASPEKYNATTTKGWPVAADLVAYHLKQMQRQMPGIYDHLQVVPIIAQGKNGRLANTRDTVEQWMLERGMNLLEQSWQVLLASLSSQPQAMYMHETALQLLPSSYRLVTVSITPTKPVVLTTVLDIAARLLYTVKGEFARA